jgi:hypothetical protein
MASGFQVFNDNNILQIDEFYKNMVLVSRGSASTGRPGGTGALPYQQSNYYKISYPVSARQPVLALRSTGFVCFITNDDGFTVFSLNPENFEFFIYDRIEFGNAAGNTGLQVFNEQGVEIFNSNNNYMRVLGAYNVNLVQTDLSNGGPRPTHSQSVQFGKRLAVAMGVQCTGYSIDVGGTPQQPTAIIRYWQCQVNTPNDNTLTLRSSEISIFGGPVSSGNQGAVASYNSGLIVDVTGI